MERTAIDWQGEQQPMPEPQGKLRESYPGKIELWKHGTRYAVVYGLQVKQHLTYAEAAMELGSCLMHHASCEGKLD